MPAPRKPLFAAEKKRKLLLSIEAATEGEAQLKLIKTKYAARVLQLCRSALQAMKKIADIEAAMDVEATKGVHEDYEAAMPNFKLTFEAVYAQQAEEADDESARLDTCMDVLLEMEKDAAAFCTPSEMAAVEVPPPQLLGFLCLCSGCRA
jgi:hypothetical protein